MTWLCHTKGQLRPQRGNTLRFFITEVISLMVILVKDGDQRGCGCVSPGGKYEPK